MIATAETVTVSGYYPTPGEPEPEPTASYEDFDRKTAEARPLFFESVATAVAVLADVRARRADAHRRLESSRAADAHARGRRDLGMAELHYWERCLGCLAGFEGTVERHLTALVLGLFLPVGQRLDLDDLPAGWQPCLVTLGRGPSVAVVPDDSGHPVLGVIDADRVDGDELGASRWDDHVDDDETD